MCPRSTTSGWESYFRQAAIHFLKGVNRVSEEATLKIDKETLEELQKLAEEGETMDQLVHRLIETVRGIQRIAEDLDKLIEAEETGRFDAV